MPSATRAIRRGRSDRRPEVRAAALALLLVALTAGAAEAQDGFRRNPRLPGEGELEADIAVGANAFRRQNGLRDLTPNNVLAGEARAYAAYLARTATFSHTADGRDPAARAQAAGYAYCEVAENLARIDENRTFIPNLSDMFMQGWEHSPGHRRNLLDPLVTETGVGVARPPGRADSYIAVQVFGRPLSDRYAFKIGNRAGRVVDFALDDRRRTIASSTTITFTRCTPSVVAIDGITEGASRFQPRPGGFYLLTAPPAGGLRLTVRPAGEDADPSN